MTSAKPSPLAVLQVIPELDAGGAERTTVDVARAVVAAGGRAWIATEGGRLAGEAEDAGATLVIGPYASKNPLTIWRNAAALADLIRRENIAIIHARSRAPAWSAYLAARRTGIIYVATYHGIYNAKSRVKRYYNAIMARGDAVIANSQYTADHVLAEHKVDKEKLHVIPRGIDIKAFTPENVSPDRIADIRKQWSLKEGKPVIVLPNRLTRWKGQLLFVEALAKLADRNFEAVMIGDAQERDAYVDELLASVDRLGLSQIVRIPGHCRDMPAAMLAADIIVAPSIEPEAFGRAAVEAQAMGRPVVASRLGAQTETIADGVTGFLFDAGDADAFAKSIAQALAMTADQRQTMASAARDRVLKSYTVDAMCTATLGIYRDLISARPNTD
ncbi:MAG: glycosyltransferase family 4 protein [Alphaproteobacteria bacterium]|nr:glycosyltransferase family 4 protein [Alphaproteobacteria bacterium]